MKININIGIFGLVVLLAIAGGAWYLISQQSTKAAMTVMLDGIPVVMRNPGGLLFVATIKAPERLTLTDPQKIAGFDFGTTISEIQVAAHYSYDIELAREWPMIIKGKTCIVTAPPIKPRFPVAFDTTTMQKRTESGWARFNKNQNLADLERSITPILAERAASSGYLRLVTDPARVTVKEFVMKWLIKEQLWKHDDPDYKIVVVFQGESVNK